MQQSADDEYRQTVDDLMVEMQREEQTKKAQAARTMAAAVAQNQRESQLKQQLMKSHMSHLKKSIALGHRAQEKSAQKSAALQSALMANIAAGLPEPEPEPGWVNPTGLTGLWRAFGATANGDQEEEFLQITVGECARALSLCSLIFSAAASLSVYL